MKLLDQLVALWKQEQPLEQLPHPGMDRRAFLKILGSSAAVVAAVPLLDLEALVWTPTPGIVAPAMGGVLTDLDWLTAEVLRMFERTLKMVSLVNRDYDTLYTRGMDVHVPLPLTRQEATTRIVTPMMTAGLHAADADPLPVSCLTNETGFAHDPKRQMVARASRHGSMISLRLAHA